MTAHERYRPAFGLLQWFHRRARRRFLDGRESASPALLALANVLSDHQEEIAGAREAGPHTLVHGDCHLGNTYRTADVCGGLLDWQIVHRGAGLSEIAYFLGSGVPAAWGLTGDIKPLSRVRPDRLRLVGTINHHHF